MQGDIMAGASKLKAYVFVIHMSLLSIRLCYVFVMIQIGLDRYSALLINLAEYRLIGSDILVIGIIGIGIGIGWNSIIGIDIGIGITENLADTMNNRYPHC